jgi:hypothetical protein
METEYTRVNYDNSTATLTVDYDEAGVATVTRETLEVLLAVASYYPPAEPPGEPVIEPA